MPGEQALFADAMAIYDAIAVRPGVDRKRIVAMGRSLGSGVATYLASQRAPKIEAPMLALIAARDSIIAPSHAQVLVKAWHGPVTLVIASHPRYWPAVREFLRK